MGIQVFYKKNGNSIPIQKLKLASQYQKKVKVEFLFKLKCTQIWFIKKKIVKRLNSKKKIKISRNSS